MVIPEQGTEQEHQIYCQAHWGLPEQGLYGVQDGTWFFQYRDHALQFDAAWRKNPPISSP